MMSPRNLRAGLVLASLFVVAPAFAEDEVRISVGDSASRVEIAGAKLAIYDGRSGARLYAWSAGGTVDVRRRGADVVARAGGREVARAQRLFFEADESIRAGSGIFFGRIETLVHKKRLLVINRLPLETYLLGIVGSEMSPAWPIEALKAQAVAARTYAVQRRMMMRAANRPYDLESSVLSQVYKGADRIRPSVIKAVAQTRGQVLSFEHDIVQALFHSTCGGRTVSARAAFGRSVPYLKPKSCRWCRGSKRHRWSLKIPLEELSTKLRRARVTRGSISDFSREDERHQVQLSGKAGTQRVSPRKIRKAVGFGELYSARFTAETKGATVHIRGRGFGHGVGMCQWGAKGMADDGRPYPQILEHYYRGVELKQIY